MVGFIGFHGSFWKEKTNPNGQACPLRFILGDFLGLCRANAGPVWIYVGAHVGSFGGLYGVPWRSLEGKNNPQHKAFVLRVILGDFLGLCRANVGPVWVYVGAHVGSPQNKWIYMDEHGCQDMPSIPNMSEPF